MSQVAYVDGGRSQLEGGGVGSSGGCTEEAEERIEVKGSYGTKVCAFPNVHVITVTCSWVLSEEV